MKRINRAGALTLLYSIAAFAQIGTGGGSTTNNTSPANVIWGIVAIMGGMASAYIAISLIWTGMQGVMSDHDQFHKLPRIGFWAAIIFSATYIATRFALGTT